MSAPARLLALRLQGFKSFAERTRVEFGPGISAVVGPNGSGKSNLADALRWTLGEQGRALRSRKSEDVIFAGSDRRAAVGMADVTIVLDNADRLLPVEYSVIELGRRLYRSGENEYLLNRQRVRLKDLVDLLDAAALADNAFLFIGQGMVDQALALRPEERRPLFEEVAGVRRHDRRRRRAEEQLSEAEDNLARVEDIIGELKPQARRLAAQAEQQLTRASAGDELAEALIVAAHTRWFEGSQRLAVAASRLTEGRVEADLAMRLLAEAEGAIADISGGLAARAEVAEAGRRRHEEARTELTGLQLRSERLAADVAGIERDRSRLNDERAAAEAALALQRTEPAEMPGPDHRLEAALAEAERALSEASAELAALQGAAGERTDAATTVRRANAARIDELDSARQRLAETTKSAAKLRGQADAGLVLGADLAARLEAARQVVAEAGEAALGTSRERDAARIEVEDAEARQRLADDRLSEARARASGVRGRHDELRARLVEEEARGIARAARRVGGRRIDEELVVEPRLRVAVDAALGPIARAYLIAPEALAGLASERGVVVPAAADSAATSPGDASGRRGSSADAAEEEFGARVRARGGGPLAEAIRRDGIGAAHGLLERTAWLPDRSALIDLWPELPAGWVLVSLDGATVATGQAIWLGRGGTALEERAELERFSGQLDRLENEAENAQRAADEAKTTAADARSRLATIRVEDARAAADLRTAEEVERAAGREAERAAREASWLVGQADHVDAELGRLRELVSGLEGELESPLYRAARPRADGQAAATDAWSVRIAELRARRDRLMAQRAEREGQRRDAEASLARAAVSREYAARQLEKTAEELLRLLARQAELGSERDRLSAAIADTTAREERDRLASEALRAADSVDRQRLLSAETDGTAARERLRRAEDQLRAAEVADLEARLGLDAIREGILVELAGIGEAALRALRGVSGALSRGPEHAAAEPDGQIVTDEDHEPDAEQAQMESALEAVLASWGSEGPFGEVPTPGRLAALRRRFHELGQANPFAVDEYAELRGRLEALEAQADDLRSAITRTRKLIDELSTMIADQFQLTFRALEAAFETRFRQLFGGGYARLELTDPGELSGTGVEIVARPPGKKAQALAMLSGGERALTAVALLFAMLQVRPVPFCVLDEVDAALDEANVGRFAEALRSLAQATQFVVITHNRGTIEAADALYGVTVGDDSVSRIISLRLDEATAIAAREADHRAVALEPAAS